MKERRREPRLWLRTLMLVGVFMLSYANAAVAQEEGGESEIVPVIGMRDGYDDKVISSTRSDGVIAPVDVTFSEADYPYGYNIYDIFVASELEYIRSFDDTEWHAWFMPFSMPVSNLPEGLVAARIVSVINSNLVVYEELGSEDVMTSNTPYLIKSTFDQTEPVTITTQNAKVLTINDQYLSEKGETGYEEIPADGMFLDGNFMYNEGQYYIRVADDNPYRWVVGSMPDYNEYAVEDIITLVSASDPNAQTIIAYAMLVSAIDDLDGAITNYGESCNPTALTAAESKLKLLQEMQTKHTATAATVNDAISNVADFIKELQKEYFAPFVDVTEWCLVAETPSYLSKKNKYELADCSSERLLTFDYTFSGSSNYNKYFSVSIDDDIVLSRYSGSASGSFSYTVPSGVHKLEFYSYCDYSTIDLRITNIRLETSTEYANRMVQEIDAALKLYEDNALADAVKAVKDVRKSLVEESLGFSDLEKISKSLPDLIDALKQGAINVIVTFSGYLSSTLEEEMTKKGLTYSTVGGITIKGEVDSYDLDVLKQFTQLQYLDMKEVTGVTYIPNYFMQEVATLRKVVLPEGVTEIGWYAFAETGLEMINLPAGLTRLHDNCFMGTKLQSITIPASVTSVGSGCFSDCALTIVPQMDGVRVIPANCFTGNKFTDIVLNDNVYSIEEEAFSAISTLKTVTLPASLEYVGDDAFAPRKGYNSTIEKITARCVVPPTGSYANPVEKYVEDIKLIVPAVAYEAYKSSDIWKDFDIEVGSYQPKKIDVLNDWDVPSNGISESYKPAINIAPSNNFETEGDMINNSGVTAAFSSFNITYADKVLQRSSTLINNGNITSDSVSVTYMVSENSWNYISLPFNARVSDITTNFRSAVAVCRYDAAKRAKGKSGWTFMEDSEVMQAGQGYIINASGNFDTSKSSYGGREVTFHAIDDAKKNSIFSRNRDVVLANSGNSDSDAFDKNWNFVGNPYPTYYDFSVVDTDLPVILYSNNYNIYQTYRPSDGDELILTPGEAFFVQAPADRAFSMPGNGRNSKKEPVGGSSESKASAKAKALNASQRSIINLSLRNSDEQESSDRTRVVVNPKAATDYEIGTDAAKMMATGTRTAQLYSLDSNAFSQAKYSINERPMEDGKVRLGAVFAEQGTYTISLESAINAEGISVSIEDTETGTITNLDGGAEYMFSAGVGECNNRFVLHLTKGGCINGINAVTEAVSDKSVYDLSGRRVTDTHQQHGVHIVNKKKIIK